MTIIEEIDFIANALIEAKTNYNLESLTKTEVDNYKKYVVEYLKEQGMEFYCGYPTRYSFENMKEDYGSLIDFSEKDGNIIYSIKPGVKLSDLWVKFRGYLSVLYMKAFMDIENVECLSNPKLVRDK